MASPASCLDEEALQNYRIRTGSNCLLVSLWGHHSEEGKGAWQKPTQGTGLPDALEVFTAHITQAFGLTL
jgi:hypothetical protein